MGITPLSTEGSGGGGGGGSGMSSGEDGQPHNIIVNTANNMARDMVVIFF